MKVALSLKQWLLIGCGPGAFALTLHACTIVNGLELPKPTDSGSSADQDAAAPRIDATVCEEVPTSRPALLDATVPPDSSDGAPAPKDAQPPPAGDAGTPIAEDRSYAVRSFAFNAGTFSNTDAQACQPISGPCQRPSGGPTAPALNECANAGGAAIDGVAGTLDISALYNQSIEEGRASLLIRVQRYDRGANDPEVIVSLYSSVGFQVCGQPRKPTWNGEEPWTINRLSLIGSNLLSTNTAVGQVVNRKLTVRFPSIDIPSDGLYLRLTDAQVSLKFDASGELQDGLVVGRWNASEAIRAIRSISGAKANEPVCQNKDLERLATQYVCNARDISSKRDAGAASVCDSISLSTAMTFGAIRLGTVRDGIKVTERCADAGAAPTCPP